MTERIVVLVNGLPGAGKTTLARTLSQALRAPLFSKDTIKEAHADVLGAEPPPGWSQRRWNSALGAAASETMWALLADAGDAAVLESCWPKDVATSSCSTCNAHAAGNRWRSGAMSRWKRPAGASKRATPAIPSTVN
jgi:hypothetical protein